MKAKHIIIFSSILIVISIAFYCLPHTTLSVKEYTIPEVVEVIWPQPEAITATASINKGWETIAEYNIALTLGSNHARKVNGQAYASPEFQVDTMDPFLMKSLLMPQNFDKYTKKSVGLPGMKNENFVSFRTDSHFSLQTLLEKTDDNSSSQRRYRFEGGKMGAPEECCSVEELKVITKNKLQEFYDEYIEWAQNRSW